MKYEQYEQPRRLAFLEQQVAFTLSSGLTPVHGTLCITAVYNTQPLADELMAGLGEDISCPLMLLK